MKKILIATDFSAASHNASLYGMQMAKALQAHVILFSAYQVSHPFAALNVQVSSFAVMEETSKLLADEAEKLPKGLVPHMELVCEEGIPDQVILAIAKEKEVDLIIVGMKGNWKSIKKLFGSTTTSLVNDISVPLIIVPEGAEYANPKNMLYASSVFFDTAIMAIDQVKWMTDYFGTNLHVVRVVKDSYEEIRERVNTPHNLRKELRVMHASFNFPINQNITDGLNEFLQDHHVDLMVLMPRKHEWLERFFEKSETKDMMFHAQKPLLLLPDAAVGVGNKAVVENI